MFEALMNQILIIVIFVMIGFLAHKANYINDEIQNSLSTFVISVIIPCSIIASANKPLEQDSLLAVGLIFIGGVVFFIGGIIIMELFVRSTKLSDNEKILTACLSIFPNAAFIGYPIVAVFLPETGTFLASIFLVVYNLFFFTYGELRISKAKKISFKAILLNINNIASVVMIIMYLLQIKLFTPFQDAIASVGSMSSAVSMIVVGSMLAKINIKGLLLDKLLYLISFIRLLVFPTLVFLVLWLIKLPMEVNTVLLVMSGLPSATLVAITAEKYNCDPELASSAIIQTVIIFMGTIFYLNYLLELL